MQTTGVFEPFNDRKGKGGCIFYNWNIKQPQIFVSPYKVIKLIVNTFFDATLLKFFPTTARARFISSYFFLFTDNRCCNRILIWYGMFFKINLINQTWTIGRKEYRTVLFSRLRIHKITFYYI